MPRKKYGVQYELLPRPTKDEDGKPLLYARPAIPVKYSMRTLDDFAHNNRGLQQGEMSRMVRTFMDVAACHMKMGERIVTPMGSFQVKLKLDGDYSDPKKVTGKNVQFAGIEFTPSKEFLSMVEDYLMGGFVYKPDLVYPKSVKELREEGVIDEALAKCLERNNFTIGTFCYHSGLKYNTARDFLNRLCKGEPPVLQKRKFGTSMLFSAYKEKEPQK